MNGWSRSHAGSFADAPRSVHSQRERRIDTRRSTRRNEGRENRDDHEHERRTPEHREVTRWDAVREIRGDPSQHHSQRRANERSDHHEPNAVA